MHRGFALVVIAGITLPTVAAMAAPNQPAGAHLRPAITLGVPLSVDRAPTMMALHHNVQPSPDYFPICAARGHNNPVCIRLEVEAIDHARAFEPMRKHALILPTNFARLSVARQTFVITNLERVDRGIRPYTGLTRMLNQISRLAATARLDPSLALTALHRFSIGEWGSVWAEDLGPLASDYDWMYNDGYASSGDLNIDCRWNGAPGCWGHRENILYPDNGYSVLSAGAGTAKPAGASIAEILTGGSSPAPAYGYTWKRALAHGADGHPITAGRHHARHRHIARSRKARTAAG